MDGRTADDLQRFGCPGARPPRHLRAGIRRPHGGRGRRVLLGLPFFARKTVTTAHGDRIELADGGYCANNPALYAIADATAALGVASQDIRLLSVGVGTYPQPKAPFFSLGRWIRYLKSVQLLQKTLEINTQSMDQLRHVLFSQVPTVRVNDTFQQPEMATDLFEHDLEKLNLLTQRGVHSFAAREAEIAALLG